LITKKKEEDEHKTLLTRLLPRSEVKL